MRKKTTACIAVLSALLCSMQCVHTPKEDKEGILGFGEHSMPVWILSSGGAFDYDDFHAGIGGGEPIDDASVIVRNVTRSTSVTLEYWDNATNYPERYAPPPRTDNPAYPQEFASSAGDVISVEIEADGETYSGSASTPDSQIAFVSPASSADCSQPFDAVVSRVDGTVCAATHVVFMLMKPYASGDRAYPWSLVAFDSEGQASFAVSGQATGTNYAIKAFPVNPMDMGEDFVAYVSSAATFVNARYFNIVQ